MTGPGFAWRRTKGWPSGSKILAMAKFSNDETLAPRPSVAKTGNCQPRFAVGDVIAEEHPVSAAVLGPKRQVRQQQRVPATSDVRQPDAVTQPRHPGTVTDAVDKRQSKPGSTDSTPWQRCEWAGGLSRC